MNDDQAVPANGMHDSTILNVNEMPLEWLIDHEKSALNEAVRRVLRRMDRPAENYAAHSSSA